MHSSSSSSATHSGGSTATHSGGAAAGSAHGGSAQTGATGPAPHSEGATGATGPAQHTAALPVWLLRPIDPQVPPFYLAGVPSMFIVAAASPEDARRIASAAAGPHDALAWLDPALAVCNRLAPEEPGIVARDFGPLAPLPAATTPPVNVDVPHVQGTGAVGDTLNCTMGNWEGEPTGYAYAWAMDGSTNGATGADYIVAAGDAGHSLSCIVTATNAAGSTAAPPSNAVTVPGSTG